VKAKKRIKQGSGGVQKKKTCPQNKRGYVEGIPKNERRRKIVWLSSTYISTRGSQRQRRKPIQFKKKQIKTQSIRRGNKSFCQGGSHLRDKSMPTNRRVKGRKGRKKKKGNEHKRWKEEENFLCTGGKKKNYGKEKEASHLRRRSIEKKKSRGDHHHIKTARVGKGKERQLRQGETRKGHSDCSRKGKLDQWVNTPGKNRTPW